MSETMRLDKLLSNLGYGTRKEIKQMAKQGMILVDGKEAKDASLHVDPVLSVVSVNGKVLKYRKYIYLMLNKPAGVISATWDPSHRTVIDILPEEYRCFDLFPVGRLDIDTEGLLLLTNDGKMAHFLLSPKRHVPKKYYVLVEGYVDKQDVIMFNEGIVLDDGYKTLPAELEIIKQSAYSEAYVTIHEGKFHQVKRMFESCGKKVKYLKRLQMGTLKLDEALVPGQARELTCEEIKNLEELYASIV